MVIKQKEQATDRRQIKRSADFELHPNKYTQGYGPEYACNLYACGYGECGQLALGDRPDRGPYGCTWAMHPVPVFVRCLETIRIRQVVARLRTCFALSVDGDVYTWGDRFPGTLGQESTYRSPISAMYQSTAEMVPFFKANGIEIVFISASDGHAAAVSRTGHLFVWGRGKEGQLGLGRDRMHHLYIPEEVSFFSSRGIRVKQVACAQKHTIVLTVDGDIYGFGDNSRGWLGLGADAPAEAIPSPKPLEVLRGRGVVFVTCGSFHSCALASNGEMYSWGAGTLGQLGHNEVRDLAFPKIVRGLGARPVVFASAGNFATCAVTNEGKVYVWGLNEYMKMGLGASAAADGLGKASNGNNVSSGGGDRSNSMAASAQAQAATLSKAMTAVGDEIVRLPTLVRGLGHKFVRQASLGPYHMAAVTSEGELYTCGRGDFGVLGRIDDLSKTVGRPVQLKFPQGIAVAAASCGWGATLILTLPLTSLHETDRVASPEAAQPVVRNRSVSPDAQIANGGASNIDDLQREIDALEGQIRVRRKRMGQSSEMPVDSHGSTM